MTNPGRKQVAWWKRPFSRKQPAIQLAGEEGEEIVLRRKASTPGEKRTIFVAVVSRCALLPCWRPHPRTQRVRYTDLLPPSSSALSMIITPLLLIPVVALLAVYDPFEVAEDPVFIATAVLVISSPPAITLAQITQASSGDAFESLISKTIWISYGILTPPRALPPPFRLASFVWLTDTDPLSVDLQSPSATSFARSTSRASDVSDSRATR